MRHLRMPGCDKIGFQPRCLNRVAGTGLAGADSREQAGAV